MLAKGLRKVHRGKEKDVLVDLSILVETWACWCDGQVLKFKSDLMSVEKASGRGGGGVKLFDWTLRGMLSSVFCYAVRSAAGGTAPAGATGCSLIQLRSQKLQRPSRLGFWSPL